MLISKLFDSQLSSTARTAPPNGILWMDCKWRESWWRLAPADLRTAVSKGWSSRWSSECSPTTPRRKSKPSPSDAARSDDSLDQVRRSKRDCIQPIANRRCWCRSETQTWWSAAVRDKGERQSSEPPIAFHRRRVVPCRKLQKVSQPQIALGSSPRTNQLWKSSKDFVLRLLNGENYE